MTERIVLTRFTTASIVLRDSVPVEQSQHLIAMNKQVKASVWLPITVNSQYEVNRIGQIRHKKNKRLLKQKITSDGYYRICLSEKGLKNGRYWSVARLVALAFIPNPNNLPQINHIDGNKKNNAVENLEWVTAKDNIAHAKRTGLIKEGDTRPRTLLRRQVFPEIYGLRKLGFTIEEIGVKFGVSKYVIYHLFKDERYKKYYNENEFRVLVNSYIEKHRDLRPNPKWASRKYAKQHPVLQKNKDGDVINRFGSVAEASRVTGSLRTSIVNNIKGRSILCGGYKYEYEL